VAIVLLCAMSEVDETALSKAKDIIKWTSSNMQSKEGSFFYRIIKVFGVTKRIKIPYLRWGQGWMFVALSVFNERESK
jgi:hypothetical protein